MGEEALQHLQQRLALRSAFRIACHVGGLAWSGVSSAIVRLYNCLCVRGAYVLSAPVPTPSTFYQVFMGRLAWSGVLTGVSQTCMCYMDRLAWSGVAKKKRE